MASFDTAKNSPGRTRRLPTESYMLAASGCGNHLGDFLLRAGLNIKARRAENNRAYFAVWRMSRNRISGLLAADSSSIDSQIAVSWSIRLYILVDDVRLPSASTAVVFTVQASSPSYVQIPSVEPPREFELKRLDPLLHWIPTNQLRGSDRLVAGGCIFNCARMYVLLCPTRTRFRQIPARLSLPIADHPGERLERLGTGFEPGR